LGTFNPLQSEIRWANLLTDDPTQSSKTIKSEVRIKQLQNHLDILREIAKETMEDTETDVTTNSIKVIGDVTKNEFRINRGMNVSTRVTDPFGSTRVEEILKAIQIGHDLTKEQREKVHTLITKYADIFALSLSDVLYIDWYKHKLNVNPEQVFPTCISQRPVTEGQTQWFHNIIDDMEKSYIIQRIPGEFIKNISSTNLAPKDPGKTDITRTEVL
jgi:hypothetical protein